MSEAAVQPWMVSLHGGHSVEYCDHAHDTLESIVEAAIDRGYRVFGMTEHAPRLGQAFLYPEERELGWDVATLERKFDGYAQESADLAKAYADRITLLRGFEAEVVPAEDYTEIMLDYKERYAFDYMVGSVHWVAGHMIDYTEEHFARAVAACGGLEPLGVRYYETVSEMVSALRPEVVGHLDLLSWLAPNGDAVDTPDIRGAAMAALDAIREHGCILDLNTAGYRKGLGRPYCAPWIVAAARARSIGFCFGDDSHRVSQVGAGVTEARAYLLQHGVDSVTALEPGADGLVKKRVALT